MIDFPASPIIGQTFTAAGVTWIWDGAKWLPNGLAPTVVPGINDNRIINGDMWVDQRNGGASGTANAYTVDRWQYQSNQLSKGTWQRNGNTPAAPGGFPYGLVFSSASAFASAATDYFQFSQAIEADMISDFQWGTASAQPVTLSFLAYTSQIGTFSGCLGNYAATRNYPFTYSIPVANTWTKIVITIPGDTTGTWPLAGNGGGAILHFDLGSGSNYRAAANVWTSTGVVGATGSVSVVGTNGAYLTLTGVKLEIGSVATPYNRQSLAKSMADCQRYFCKTYLQSQTPGQALTDDSALAVFTFEGGGTQYNDTTWSFPVTMRASATITLYSPHTGVSGKAWLQNSAADMAAAPGNASDCTATLTLSGVTTSATDFAKFHAVASAEL